MLGPQSLDEIADQLIQPRKGLQERIPVKCPPVVAAVMLQDPEEGPQISNRAEDRNGPVGTALELSAKITLVKKVIHQLLAQGFVGTGAPGDVCAKTQIHLTHPSGSYRQGLQAQLPEEGCKFRIPKPVIQHLVREHHPVQDLPQAETFFQMNADMLEQDQPVLGFRKAEEAEVIQTNGFRRVNRAKDPPVGQLPLFGVTSIPGGRFLQLLSAGLKAELA